jgi:hypothetical protein
MIRRGTHDRVDRNDDLVHGIDCDVVQFVQVRKGVSMIAQLWPASRRHVNRASPYGRLLSAGPPYGTLRV